MLLALITVPHVVFVEELSLLELVEALVDVNLVLALLDHHVLKALCLFIAREVSLDLFVEVPLPYEVENKVFLAVVVVEVAHIVFLSNLVQHVKHGEVAGVGQRAVDVVHLVSAEVAALAIH